MCLLSPPSRLSLLYGAAPPTRAFRAHEGRAPGSLPADSLSPEGRPSRQQLGLECSAGGGQLFRGARPARNLP